MSPSDIPEDLLAVFDLQVAMYDVDVEEKVVTRPAPTKQAERFHDEPLAYAFANPGQTGRPEAECWRNALNEGIEKPVIYNSLKKPKKFMEFDFKDFS